MDNQLVIRIELDNDRYIATSTQFPGCVGIGKNEKEALRELGKSVISSMENNLKNVVKLIENPKLVRVKARNLVSEKLRFLDKIFHSLGMSVKARKDVLKMFVNVDLRLDKEVLGSFDINKIKSEPMFVDDEEDPYQSPDMTSEDSGGFIISMPINLN